MNEKNEVRKIEDSIISINDNCRKIDESFMYFSRTHQAVRECSGFEGDFRNNVTYFYSLFVERGNIFWNYISQKMQLYSLEYDKVKRSYDMICYLRTYYDHSLDDLKEHDKKIKVNVEKWIYMVCGNFQLQNEDDILACSRKLMDMALIILENIQNCLDRILSFESKETVVRDMKECKDNAWPDYQIEEIFEKILQRLGIQLDAHVLTKKHAHKLRLKMQLTSMRDRQERERYLEGQIEILLYSEGLDVCPLSAIQLMEVFNLEPGPAVGKLMGQAMNIFKADRTITKEQILSKLVVSKQGN